ncbi:hypothetical protein AM493_08365 [Flavobacterium akiainvivens]|uniref:Lipoprotein n=1 Tax=Flavobacterium akiainvivens TaxID=1202724 RepID=A0A0M9VHY3_9FLAO|nr:hypothetical protein [Flavobacterium akiainvivens]KOS06052.1 hypothetical protein AM493_08365 [Flavobacterium akiainvivens]SFQ54562.1 hypothetical protein SAMN05444144_107155 [Flavobacterium akiainvivens]
MKKLLIFLSIAVAGCASVETDTITVTGVVGNSKAGHVINNENGEYILEGVNLDSSYLNKKITVTGRLAYIPNPEPEDKSILVQRRSGTGDYRVIKNTKVILVETP